MPVMEYRGTVWNSTGGSFAVKMEEWDEIVARWAPTGRIRQLERPCHSNGWVGRIYLNE